MNLRYLRKKDGTNVLQQLTHINPVLDGKLVYVVPKYEWQDIPTVEEKDDENAPPSQ